MKRVYFSHWKTTQVAALAVVAGLAAWALSSRSVAQSSAGQVRTAATTIDRAPTWHHDPDPYDAFSGGVAVDTVRNEIVVQSPKKLIVYDRQANTPRAATLTEPKRMIAGPKTQMSDNCGLYVDSKNGEIYTMHIDGIMRVMTLLGRSHQMRRYRSSIMAMSAGLLVLLATSLAAGLARKRIGDIWP